MSVGVMKPPEGKKENRKQEKKRKHSYSPHETKRKELVWHQCATAEMSGVLVLHIRAFVP